MAPGAAFLEEPGALAFAGRNAPRAQRLRHGVPAIRRVADPEVLDRRGVEPALGEIAGAGALRLRQGRAIALLGQLVRLLERLRTASLAGAAVGHLDAVLSGQGADGLREAQVLHPHQEAEGVAALAAAEALERLTLRRDYERGCLFFVEGAEAFVVATCGLEAYESTDEVDDVDAITNLLDDLVRDPSQAFPTPL